MSPERFEFAVLTRQSPTVSIARRATCWWRQESVAMKAHLVGFELHVDKTIPLADFFDYLRGLKGQQINFAGHDRMISIGDRDEYYAGLLFTVKDQDKYCELRSKDGEIKINVRSLEDGTSIVDFNFFMVHKETGRGLYLHYHQSCSVNQFGLFLRARYRDLRDSKKEQEILKLGHSPTEKARKAVGKQFKKVALRLVVMVRKEKLKSLLEEFDRITVFEFDVQAMVSNDPEYAPVKPYVRRETRRFRFFAEASQSAIKGWIDKACGALGVGRGRVEGKDEDGETMAYRLMDNPDSFGSFEYEEIADDSVLSFSNFEQSPLLDGMSSVLREHHHIFETPAQ